MPYLRCLRHSTDTYVAELKDEFDYEKEFEPRWWRLCIMPDGELHIEEELLGQLDWKADDLLEWFEIGDTEFLLIKIVKS